MSNGTEVDVDDLLEELELDSPGNKPAAGKAQVGP
jgi:hypothetical protein